VYIPNRLEEGYGINEDAIKYVIEELIFVQIVILITKSKIYKK
jgi:single-stranded DNA-specific DHH superfamily exonuclease